MWGWVVLSGGLCRLGCMGSQGGVSDVRFKGSVLLGEREEAL